MARTFEFDVLQWPALRRAHENHRGYRVFRSGLQDSRMSRNCVPPASPAPGPPPNRTIGAVLKPISSFGACTCVRQLNSQRSDGRRERSVGLENVLPRQNSACLDNRNRPYTAHPSNGLRGNPRLKLLRSRHLFAPCNRKNKANPGKHNGSPLMRRRPNRANSLIFAD